jgi:hypothetical protein
MSGSLKGLGITAFIVLGLLWMLFSVYGKAGIATAAEQEFTGEVARVGPRAGQLILNVVDGQSAEGKQVIVKVEPGTDLEGVKDLSELKQGTPVKVRAEKSWYMREWVARRLIYSPSKGPQGLNAQGSQGMSPTESAGLHDMENRAAHGQMGDVEFETKRQGLER